MKTLFTTMKTKTFFLSLIFLCAGWASLPNVQAQDTDFWFVAPHLTNNYARPVYFMITAGDEPADVTMEMPALSGFNSRVLHLAAHQSEQILFSSAQQLDTIHNDILTSGIVGVKYNRGIHFSATTPVSIYYQVNNTYSKDMFVLKGAKALGTEFYTPFQTLFTTSSTYSNTYAQFHIVATKDNTTVNITPNADIVGTTAGSTKTVILNRGETFAARANVFMQTNWLAGSHITSNEPVAVTVCDDLLNVNTSADVTGDQLVPTNNVGTTYVVIRGFANSTSANCDNVFILATQNNTTISINGTPTGGIMSAGQQYCHSMPSDLTAVIESNNPVYVYHLSGAGTGDRMELGAALIPSMYSINSKRIIFNKEAGSNDHNIFVMVRDGNEGFFTVNGNSSILQASDFTNVPNMTGWKYARKDISSSVGNGTTVVNNSKGAFSIGYFHSISLGSSSYGYLSGYGSLSFPDTTYKCAGSSVTLDGGYAKSYYWTLPGSSVHPTTATITATDTGRYTVIVDQDPFLITATTVVMDRFINSSIVSSGGNGIEAGAGTYTYSVNLRQSSTNVSYVWKVDGVQVSTAATYSAIWTDSDQRLITVEITDDVLGCTKTLSHVHLHKLPDNIIDADCYVEPPTQVFTIKQERYSDEIVANISTPMVGDLLDANGNPGRDGVPEVVVKGHDGTTYNKVRIFKNDLTLHETIHVDFTAGGLSDPYAIADVNNDDIGEILIATSRVDGDYLYAYTADGNMVWKSNESFLDASLTHAPLTDGPNISIADIDHDGLVEILVGDRIFAGESGKLLVSLPATGTNGRGIGIQPGHWGYFSIFGDVDGDGYMEAVCGRTTYTVRINSRTNPSLNTATVLASMTGRADGFCSVGDIDGDGILDVVVTEYPGHMYAWQGSRDEQIGQLVGAGANLGSRPFIGDIDGDGWADIAFTSVFRMEAFKYNPVTKQFETLFSRTTTDGSGRTTMCMFDFDHDGAAELVYRDEDYLMIIGPDGLIKKDADGVEAKYRCDSGSSSENPIVVDFDGDGHADILVTGSLTPIGEAYQGRVIVYSSKIPGTWAPARKVWNQLGYNVVNINEDLSVPRYPLNPATVFPGKDQILGTADDVRPYNNFLQQQTMLDKYGTPMWLAINAQITGNAAEYYDAAGDSLTITLQIHNAGDAAIQPPFYISAYKNDILPANVIATDSLMDFVYPGSTEEIKVIIRNVTSLLPIDSIKIQLNDRGNAAMQQSECDYTTNVVITPLSAILMAHHDHAVTLTTTPVKVDVMANDSIPDGCTPALSVSPTSAHGGAATIVNDSVQYTAAAGFVGYDTVTYSVDCGGAASTAQVYILVYDKPDNIVEQEDCYVPTEPFEFKIKQQWENQKAGNQFTSPLVGDLDGDGLPEIVAYTSSTSYSSVPSITIYNGQNGMPKDTIFLSSSANGTSGWHPVMTAAIVDADRNGLGELIFTNPNRTVKSYKTDTTGGKFNLIPNWESATLFENPVAKDYLPQPIVADFNSDGVPEVLVYNKIYNAVTGHYLGETETIATAYVGRINGRPGNACSNFIAAADFDGDGVPEIAAGGKVYKVNFNATKTAVTCSIWEQHTGVIDGFTAVADVDMDGILDVVVVNGMPISAVTATRIQIWTPATKYKFEDIDVYDGAGANSTRQSYPFIGDIDGYIDPVTGKKYPEICVTTVSRVSAFKYNPSTGKFVSKWVLSTSDTSGGTGITLFDFNNDGINEIVYRDETLLRVLNGVADATPVLADPDASFSCKSGTAFEYPVIADTDGDGSANICVTCAVSLDNVPNYLRVYESGSAPWAPTRKVWNQVNYEPTQINEDLTVPQFPIPKNTAFAGKYPYNGALIQVPTMVNEEFSIVQLAPDPAVDAVWIETVDASNLKVCVRIKNLGVKNTNPTLPVALYKGAIASASPAGGANYIASLPLGAAVAPGDKHTLCFTIANTQLEPQMSIRIQDDGTKFPADGSYLDCDLTNNIGTGGSLLAIRDYVIGDSINPSVFNVLDNDYLASCGKGALDAFDTVANIGLKHGALTIDLADSSFTYIPAKNFLGVDSVVYYIKCGSDSSAAKVYILTQQPLSQKYVACPNALVTIGFAPISGVTYHWYNAETGGSIVSGGNPANSLNITKGAAADIGTWWVEARAGSIVFPRYRVDLELGDCGLTNPTGCAATGRAIFKEDFGGNNVSDPLWSPTPLPTGTTTYNFRSDGLVDGDYCLIKHMPTGGGWYAYEDHTIAGTDRGYYMLINASVEPKLFYTVTISGLCNDMKLYFSIWVSNMMISTYYGDGGVKPMLRFILEDAVTLETLATYTTGNIPALSSPTWALYGFEFVNHSGSVKLSIYNDAPGGNGNDLGLDDMSIRLCVPQVSTNITDNDTIVCAGNSLDITGTYGADCTFGNELAYRWEFRHVDSVNWKTLTTESGVETINCSAAPTINKTKSIASASKADEGYYRMSVSSPTSIGSVNCRASSDSVHVRIVDKYVAPDIRIQICPSPPARTVQLSKYLDSTDYDIIKWEQVSPYPVIANSETGLIQDANLYKGSTYTLKYTLRSPEYLGCGESTAKVYMRVLNNKVLGKTVDTIVICSALATSRSVNLNQISGLELGGVWTYPNPDNVVFNNVKEFTAPSKYAGAVVFNAQKAYAEANSSYDVSYKGVSGKAFNFVYTASPSCFNVTKRIVLVVTD